MNDEHTALIALLRALPEGRSWRKLTDEVLECGSAATVWERYQPPQLLDAPGAVDGLAAAEAELDAWERKGMSFLSVLDKDYPQRLLDIVETPPFLFARGHLEPTDPGLSVVGSRQASARGIDMASRIATYLVRQGLTVIAGLALGIDTAAHKAALDVGGRTVAFVATGLTRTYPPENADLQAAIVGNGGLLLSQFLPDAPPRKQHFLMRNALMSGYGLATIVVEAGEHSGARAQARMAVEHGRPVILTDLVVRTNAWAKALLDRPGVQVASSVDDIGRYVDEIREQPDRLDAALRQLAIR
jgi:DNA processing protein